MKVAFVNQPLDAVIPPNQNSIGIWTYQVAPHVARAHEVSVYARRTREQRSWNGQKDVRYIFTPSVPKRLGDRYWNLVAARPSRVPVYASRFHSFGYILPVALGLRRQKAEVVHIHNYTQFVPVVRALNPGAKIVLHMNCEWLSQLDYDVMEQRLRQADLVLGSSNYITEKVRQRFPRYASRCRTVYNGVDADYFAAQDGDKPPAADGTKRVLFVGRISQEKGIHTLLEAFKIVAARSAEARLDIVGPFGAAPLEFIVGVSDDPAVKQLASLYQEDYGTYLQRLVSSGLTDRVRFLGGVPQAELRKHYQAAHVLVNPSFSESFGMSLVEAMASEKPVVATRAGGMVEVVDNGRAGLLVERGDVPALAEAILRLLEDEGLRQTLGRAGRQRVLEHFSWSRVASSLLDHYASLS